MQSFLSALTPLHPAQVQWVAVCFIEDLAFNGKTRFVDFERPMRLQHTNYDVLSFILYSATATHTHKHVHAHICVDTYTCAQTCMYTHRHTGLHQIPDLCRASALGHLPCSLRCLLTGAALTKTESGNQGRGRGRSRQKLVEQSSSYVRPLTSVSR